jgi:hypothetical protein
VPCEEPPIQVEQHRFFSTEDSRSFSIEQRVMIASAPSIGLEGIDRYFKARRNVLDFIVHLRGVGEPGTLALDLQAAARSIEKAVKEYPRTR